MTREEIVEEKIQNLLVNECNFKYYKERLIFDVNKETNEDISVKDHYWFTVWFNCYNPTMWNFENIEKNKITKPNISYTSNFAKTTKDFTFLIYWQGAGNDKYYLDFMILNKKEKRLCNEKDFKTLHPLKAGDNENIVMSWFNDITRNMINAF